MKSRTLVICRFNRDLDWWTDKLSNLYNFNIMQKDDKNNFFPIIHGENLNSYHQRLFKDIIETGKLQEFLNNTTPGTYPNIGFDSHTLFSYVIDNYDNLSDITVFVHELPTNHCQDIVEQILNLEEDIKYKEFGNVYNCNKNGEPEDSEVPVSELYEKLFNDESPESFSFVSGACFAVSKDNILKRPKEFYQKAKELIYTHWKSTWAFERLYRLIFNNEEINVRSR